MLRFRNITEAPAAHESGHEAVRHVAMDQREDRSAFSEVERLRFRY